MGRGCLEPQFLSNDLLRTGRAPPVSEPDGELSGDVPASEPDGGLSLELLGGLLFGGLPELGLSLVVLGGLLELLG